MAYYERLSALDASFLGIEDESCHMHVGGVMIFDAAPLRTAGGRHRHRPHPQGDSCAPAPGAALPPAPRVRPVRAHSDLGRRRPLPPGLPRAPHGAAAAGRRARAEAPGRAHHVAAARPQAAALGDVGRRGARRRPLRADQQDASLHDRRHLGRRPDVGDHEPVSRKPSRATPEPWRPRPQPSGVRAGARRGRPARRAADHRRRSASPRPIRNPEPQLRDARRGRRRHRARPSRRR